VFSPFFVNGKAVSIAATYSYHMYQLSEERMRIARNIKLIRELRNYNQRYVASEIGIGRSTLSTWENGLTELNIDKLMQLAAVFGLANYREIIDFDPDALFRKK
jgi:DNA-binding XRE family transcriptional regulator